MGTYICISDQGRIQTQSQTKCYKYTYSHNARSRKAEICRASFLRDSTKIPWYRVLSVTTEPLTVNETPNILEPEIDEVLDVNVSTNSVHMVNHTYSATIRY
jgi:hypothetical protein